MLNSSGGTFKTVADVIDAINATDIGVEARIDSSGSGILLFDTAGGSGTLKVEEFAGGTTAADLGLNATVKSIEVDGELRQTIDGKGKFTQSADQSALGALVSRINALQAGVTASSVFDGSGYRLSHFRRQDRGRQRAARRRPRRRLGLQRVQRTRTTP